MSTVAENLARIQERIHAAERRSGRDGEVKLVAVTKTVDPERIAEAFEAGQRVFGENRVQEGAAKVAALSPSMPGASWHLIGHLQSNKARSAVETFSLIESVDSVRLAQKLDHLAAEAGRVLPVLVEINVAGEESKHGMTVEEFRSGVEDLLLFRNLEVRGLMTVAPLAEDREEVRPVFRALRDLADWARNSFPGTGFRELSMGMSGDFEVAIEEGATMVRIGRALFGVRPGE
jgi:pyridoxal phosphate enzyme (YggS family)